MQTPAFLKGIKRTPQETKAIIEQIHHEFETSAEKMLAEAMIILGGYNKEKALTLIKHGFHSTQEAMKHKEVSMTAETAGLIQYYQNKYPLNRFITESQVLAICKKYGLVCAPVENFKGFVPETKLQQIDGFHVDEKDKEVDYIKILSAWDTGAPGGDFVRRERGANHLHRLAGLDLIPMNHPDLYYVRGDPFSFRGGYIEEIQKVEKSKLRICAPKKDFDLKGLRESGIHFNSYSTITFPDPVVIQPVKGGYLIVAAWGDEASDENVINAINN